MIVGSSKISARQNSYLESAKRFHSRPERLLEIFVELFNNTDIKNEQEELHPDWITIFESIRSSLRDITPERFFSEIEDFFESAKPIDKKVEQLDPTKMRISFLLGAGASKPSPSNIPTVKELLPQLLERARRLDREDVSKLADFCDKRKIDNIEDLLTAAQLASFCSKSPVVLQMMNYLLYRIDSDEAQDESLSASVRDRFGVRRTRITLDQAADLSSIAFLQDTLQVLFGLLSSTMLPAEPNPTHQSIAAYAKLHATSSIVTTNYDCCIDRALEDIEKPVDYGIEFSNCATNTSSGCTALIKLHGSLHWYYCETCQEVQLVNVKQMVSGFLNDSSPYAVIGLCKDCGGQRRGLLVPPLAMKFDAAPPLTPLLSKANLAFEAADLIVVVGFSFADADIYISRMLSKSMQTSPTQRILIVDPDDRVSSRVRRKFKASIPSFNTDRVLKITGDCSKYLPQFLNGEMKEQPQGGSESAIPKDKV